MDKGGESWDEVSNKKLNQNGLIAGRLDEINQVRSHGESPIRSMLYRTGKTTIKAKWADIHKGDEVNEGAG